MIGVYVARAADGTVLYVGSSGDIDRRLRQHKKSASAWWSEVADVERHEAESRMLAYHLERDLILSLKPLHNQRSTKRPKVVSRAVGPVVKPRPEALASVIEANGGRTRLAKTLGIDGMTLSDIWRGVSFPSSKVVARLIVVTGLSFDDLFYVDNVGDSDDWHSRRAPRRSRAEATA